MNLEEGYYAVFIFLGLIAMLTGIHASMNEANSVATNNDTMQVQEEYQHLQDLVSNESAEEVSNYGLIEKVKTISNPLEDLFSTASALLYIVPQFIDLLLAPLSMYHSVLNTAGSSIPFIDRSTTDLVYYLTLIGFAFGAIALYIGRDP